MDMDFVNNLLRNFFDWNILGSFVGCLAMVMVVAHLTRNLGFSKKVPPQVWDYILAVVILTFATIFTTKYNAEKGLLVLFNAAIVSFAANGGHDVLMKIKEMIKSEVEL